MTTDRQKLALGFCKEQGFSAYVGDKNDFNSVSTYLGKYLNAAKRKYKMQLEEDARLQREFEEEVIWDNIGADIWGLKINLYAFQKRLDYKWFVKILV